MGLLGDFRVEAGSDHVRLRGRKAKAILAYLAVVPNRLVSRDRAADLLWSDRGTEQARGSLRQMLAELRASPRIADAIVVSRESIAFGANLVVSDVDAILAATEKRDAVALAHHIAGVGETFLADLSEVSMAFDEWLAVERVRQPERVVVAVCAGLPDMIGRAAPMHIQEILRSLDRLDPWNEAIARLGFSADHAAGDIASLHRRYRRLCDGLTKEFGVDPSTETQTMFERLSTTGTPAPVGPVVAAPSASAVLPTVLVSPIETITDDRVSHDIAGVLTDDIRTALAPYREIRVVALAADVASVKDTVADALAAYVLTGKIRLIGAQIRLNLQLGNIATGIIVWSDQLSVEQTDLSSAIDDVVAKAVGSILPAIESDITSMPELAAYAGADDIILFAKARRLMSFDRTLPEIQAAAAMLEEIVERNPRHVHATIWLARMYNTDFWQKIAGHDVAAFRARALDLARRATAYEPSDGRLLLRLSWCYLRSRNWPRADRGFRKAITQMLNHADSMNECAAGLCILGELEDAERYMQRAFALNPAAPAHYHADHAVLLMLKGDAQAAEEHFEVCGERGLMYLAARLANAAYLPAFEQAEREVLLVEFTTLFHDAWQTERELTLSGALDWARDTLPFKLAEHAERLRNGLEAMLSATWPANLRTTR
ncbi:hypothetical protein KZX46_02770 (plasmid) [Polymorphobacter sp. PAMC 29334]|nr:hypothetical protein KZX46_02770 [Polymorphobacter sp. PAMC 29334]